MRIFVDRQAIAANRAGAFDPVLKVETDDGTIRAFDVELVGPSRVVYRPDAPRPCGAVVWIESDGPALVDGAAVTARARE